MLGSGIHFAGAGYAVAPSFLRRLGDSRGVLGRRSGRAKSGGSRIHLEKLAWRFFEGQAGRRGRADRGRRVCFQGVDDPDCATPQSHDLLLNFEFDSDRLTPSAMENLLQVAATLKDPQLHDVKFEIDGYTDATGSDVYNLSLSERRAASVVNFLISNGVPRSELAAKGFGKSKPRVADPYSPENRRVETHLTLE